MNQDADATTPKHLRGIALSPRTVDVDEGAALPELRRYPIE
jgi:hypothetical protein